MRARYIKVFRDITANLPRSIILSLAIAVGVISVGAIIGGYSVLNREMRNNYLGSSPAHATIRTEGAGIDESLVHTVQGMEQVKAAERHATVTARMKVGDKWHTMLIFGIDDFSHIKTNKIRHVAGARSPEGMSMLVERTALRVMKAEVGDSLLVRGANNKTERVTISGVVHDPGLAPAWQEQTGYAYVTMDTLRSLGYSQGFDEMRVLFDSPVSSLADIEHQAGAVAGVIESTGRHIHEIQVPSPAKHPHQGQMNAVLSLLTLFGFATLVLGSVLVASAVATMMTRQIREIGVMKAVGARSSQITGMYMVYMLIIALAAVVVAVPLGRIGSGLIVGAVSNLINIDIQNSSVPAWVILLQAVAGILVPLIAAAVPVIKGSAITVRRAITDYGASAPDRLDRAISKIDLPGDTFTLSVRNIFRRRPRLALTLILLAAGGAMFMAAMNISSAWDRNLDKLMLYKRYDIELNLAGPVPDKLSIIGDIGSLAGVEKAEAWNSDDMAFYTEGTYDTVRTYPDKRHASSAMVALPPDTTLVQLPVTEGTWFSAGDTREVVLNHMAKAQRPDIKVGDMINLSSGGRVGAWRVAGFVDDVWTPAATAYVSMADFNAYAGKDAGFNMIRIALKDRSPQSVESMMRKIEQLIDEQGLTISSAYPMTDIHNAVAEHMGVLVYMLLALALMMLCVGVLGLGSTMSMNVIERTRELGIMRAIGATPGKVTRIVMAEGIVTGLMSLALAIPLSLGISAHMGDFIGMMAFKTSLGLVVNYKAMGLWILLLALGSAATTSFPAIRSGRMSTREALAYE